MPQQLLGTGPPLRRPVEACRDKASVGLRPGCWDSDGLVKYILLHLVHSDAGKGSGPSRDFPGQHAHCPDVDLVAVCGPLLAAVVAATPACRLYHFWCNVVGRTYLQSP